MPTLAISSVAPLESMIGENLTPSVVLVLANAMTLFLPERVSTVAFSATISVSASWILCMTLGPFSTQWS